jgi:hypothetical protein
VIEPDPAACEHCGSRRNAAQEIAGGTVHTTNRRFSTRCARLGVVALIGASVIVVAQAGIGSSGASSSGSADLRVRPTTTANGTSSNQTVITDHIANLGPSTATNIVAVALLKTNSPSTSYTTSNAACEQEPAPSGWSFMFTCQKDSLAAGFAWIPKFTITGTTGSTLTRFLSVGENGPGDPVSSNNSTTLQTFIGAEADLSVAQRASNVGAASGDATVTATVKNNGPWTANSLQFVGEINSPGWSSVFYTSNISGTSCQFIPPANGFNVAVSCTTSSSLAPGKSWVLTGSYTGTPGGSLVVQGSASANNPPDPLSSNDTVSTSTSYAP